MRDIYVVGFERSHSGDVPPEFTMNLPVPVLAEPLDKASVVVKTKDLQGGEARESMKQGNGGLAAKPDSDSRGGQTIWAWLKFGEWGAKYNARLERSKLFACGVPSDALNLVCVRGITIKSQAVVR